MKRILCIKKTMIVLTIAFVSRIPAAYMVISVDIPLYEAEINGMRMEDGYLITENGAERLTDAPRIVRK